MPHIYAQTATFEDEGMENFLLMLNIKIRWFLNDTSTTAPTEILYPDIGQLLDDLYLSLDRQSVLQFICVYFFLNIFKYLK